MIKQVRVVVTTGCCWTVGLRCLGGMPMGVYPAGHVVSDKIRNMVHMRIQ